MKKITTLLASLSLVLTLQAESPEKISYQAIIRNTKGELVINQAIGMKISIYFYNKTVPVISYAETQTPTTDENGLVSIEIGTGKVVTGVFADINWAVRAYYLKIEIDPGGRTSYSITSDTQILSVPYALHAKTAENFTETDPTWKGAADTLAAIGRKGNVGIGTTAPAALLHTLGKGKGEGNVLFTGILDTFDPGDPPASGAGTRLMWYPDKAAFRVGLTEGKHWDKDSIGYFSMAMGRNTKAKGNSSTTMGYSTTASGNSSTAMGIYTTAPSYCETVTGKYNTGYTPKSTDSWDSNDRLFVVGNGTDEKNRSNALTILKNGNMTVGGDLQVNSDINVIGKVKGESVIAEVVRVREGKGILRFTDGNQRKMQTFSVPVNLTIASGSTVSIDFTFPEVFGASPAVWVGNVNWGGGGFAELVMSVGQITDGKGKLFIYNPKSSSQSPNFTVNVIAMGAE